MKTTFPLLAALAVTALFAAPVSAVTVNIDFNSSSSPTYSGVAAAPDLGTTWNAFDGGSETNAAVVESFGNATGITLSKSSAASFNDSGGGSGPANALMQDYLHNSNNVNFVGTVTFGGLMPNGTYDL